ncbi:MAG: ATP-binding protein [Clostridiaceae bacterium]|jgi:hypothetical protein|nr:ATP-binding protein [Clostridiaceae bacterium]
MITPIAFADSLRIGSVDFVSPDEIKVLLDIEAPNYVALNTGVARPFPRINNYVLLPSESGFLVGQIEWITIERSQYPKRKGMQDFGVIDLPFPLRKMSLIPLGVLHEEKKDKKSTYKFTRGVEFFPTVGDPVLLPSQQQLKSIVESGDNRRVKIGISPLASNADVFVDPDRLFGRHLAILGNTGSGKSCSVAGMIRWSIEAARKAKDSESSINSRFIILDPNGEYSRAFSDMDNVNVYAVEADEQNGVKQLQVPLWFWNSTEWCAFTQASSGAQKPTLIQALRAVRDRQVSISTQTPSYMMRRFLRTVVSILSIEKSQGNPWGNFPKDKSFFDKLKAWQNELVANVEYTRQENLSLQLLKTKVDQLVQAREINYPVWVFAPQDVDELIELASAAHSAFGGSDKGAFSIDADIPRPFTGEELLRSIEATSELMGTSAYVEMMLIRIRTLLSDSRMKMITTCDDDLTLEKWLDDYICPSGTDAGVITIIDLSLVPAEIVHIITAVIARMTLESLQRYKKVNGGKTLPTTLVMEEAHTFIRRYAINTDEMPISSMCTQVFEKIAREGRKFGLGLVLSSQRPSELSPTVLSQCNTFLLHRISNDRDQELVNKLVPDNLRGLLRELPSLPSQRAILLGWASELPVMVHMNYLNEEHRPQSNDPDYWNIWTATDEPQEVDWGTVAHDWQDAGQIREDLNVLLESGSDEEV